MIKINEVKSGRRKWLKIIQLFDGILAIVIFHLG